MAYKVRLVLSYDLQFSSSHFCLKAYWYCQYIRILFGDMLQIVFGCLLLVISWGGHSSHNPFFLSWLLCDACITVAFPADCLKRSSTRHELGTWRSTSDLATTRRCLSLRRLKRNTSCGTIRLNPSTTMSESPLETVDSRNRHCVTKMTQLNVDSTVPVKIYG